MNSRIYPHPFFAREGRPFIIGTFAVTAVLWLLDWNFLAFLSLVLFVFCVQFFRDPARELPTDPKAVLSPVDGRVCKVQKAQDPLTGEDAMMISIFMNVFNVHSQKSPSLVASRRSSTSLVSSSTPILTRLRLITSATPFASRLTRVEA